MYLNRDFCTVQVPQRRDNITTCNQVVKIQYENPGWEIDMELSGFQDMNDADVKKLLWSYAGKDDASRDCYLFKSVLSITKIKI